MKFIYWLIKIVFLFVVLFVGDTYLKGLGWWSLAICVIAFTLGTLLIDKKIGKYNKQYFLKRLPILADLKIGQIITIELFDGKELSNRVYADMISTEILILADPILDQGPEELVKNNNKTMMKTRWIKLKKVKAIKIVS